MYNIKSVAKMLDMPAVTIRAWERRYQVVNPTRSESGHRLYSEQDIEDLRWLKAQTEERGLNISLAVRMLEHIRKQRDAVLCPAEPLEAATFETMRCDLLDALGSFDVGKAQTIVAIGLSVFHYDQIFHQVLVPMLYQVGERWETGEWTVAQEHFASQFTMRRLFALWQAFPLNPALQKVMAVCPEGEWHQIGLVLFTMFLRRNGYDVLYLGANMPLQELDQVIEQHAVRTMAVSLTDPQKAADSLKLLKELYERHPQLRVVIGGQGFAGADEDEAYVMLGGDVESWNRWLQQVGQTRGT